jgi:hypothetical protein
MIRALLIALCLLLTAAAAVAEDLWVLWDQSVYEVAGQEPAVLWTQWGSATTKASCEKQRSEERQRYELMSKSFPNDWSTQGDVFVFKSDGKVIQRIGHYCYPSKINPRWEHIAARGDWYLMGPPWSVYDKTAAYLRAYQVLSDRALNEWNLLEAFESRQVCEIMRDSLRHIEESIYSRAAADYLKMMAGQTEPTLLSLRRLTVETSYANVRTYMTSRCVYRGDRELPRGLRGGGR